MTSVESFRQEASVWLDANLERRQAARRGPRLQIVDDDGADERLVDARRLQRMLFDAGLAGISFPVEVGGRGLTEEHERAFAELAAEYRTPDFGLLGHTTSLCARTLLAHASPTLVQRHIPRILAGEELWVQFFSEPDAGSDLAGVRTRGTREGDRWIINGAKTWSSGADRADFGMCLARTNWDVPKHRGLTWFAMPTRGPGITLRPIRQINGGREFCEEFFDDVELTDEDVIGAVDDGWTVTQTVLLLERGATRLTDPFEHDRGAVAPDLVSLARSVGRGSDPVARQLIARAHINDVALQELGARLEARLRTGKANHGVVAYYKLAQGVLDPIRARIAIELGRGKALTWPLGDIPAMTTGMEYLNARLMSIAGGTNEIQRNSIGEQVLGLPREPTFDTTKSYREVLLDAVNWNGKVS